jgi:hypothetical protein
VGASDAPPSPMSSQSDDERVRPVLRSDRELGSAAGDCDISRLHRGSGQSVVGNARGLLKDAA